MLGVHGFRFVTHKCVDVSPLQEMLELGSLLEGSQMIGGFDDCLCFADRLYKRITLLEPRFARLVLSISFDLRIEKRLKQGSSYDTYL